VKVLAFPRDPNPYQELLYSEMRKIGFKVSYVGCLTSFPSVNLALLPLELAVRRAMGAKMVHLHWVWGFKIPALRRIPVTRGFDYAWFRLCLATIRILGMKLTWTAHNVLPHDQVFADDIAARRILVRHCDVVFGHSEWAIASLTELGARPARAVVVRHPAFGQRGSRPPLAGGTGDGQTEFLFFGKIFEYKGVEELLEAVAELPESVSARVTVAGECDDPRLRARLQELAKRCGTRVTLRLGHVADNEIPGLMGSADVVVLPFRRVTTSGSTMLAFGYGKPLITPALPALSGLPSDAVFRYDGSIAGLSKVLREVSDGDRETLGRMGRAALDYAGEATWAQLAETTAAEFRRLLAEPAG
jgi:glycosyltransferase involved in cell wall biosynthesis